MSIRYGFFEAVKQADNTYDRTYTNEDFTSYFDGLINQNGVFYNYGDRFEISKVTGSMNIRVGTGKALINGHWVEIQGSPEILTIDKNVDLFSKRIDAVCLRYNSSRAERNISVAIVKGVSLPTEYPDIYPEQLGYIVDPKDSSRGTFDSNSEIIELVLAYIHIPSGTTSLDNSKVWIENMVGSYRAPWISQLTYNPDDKNMRNVDEYLASYREKFINWFNTVQDECQINTDIGYVSISKIGKEDGSSYSWVYLDVDNYEYNPNDLMLVYHNGMLLESHEYVMGISTSSAHEGAWYVQVITGDNLNTTPLYPGDTMRVVIIKGQAFNLPSADSVKY